MSLKWIRTANESGNIKYQYIYDQNLSLEVFRLSQFKSRGWQWRIYYGRGRSRGGENTNFKEAKRKLIKKLKEILAKEIATKSLKETAIEFQELLGTKKKVRKNRRKEHNKLLDLLI